MAQSSSRLVLICVMVCLVAFILGVEAGGGRIQMANARKSRGRDADLLLLRSRQSRIIDQVQGELRGGKRSYGFASICEIEVAKYYCAIAPHDAFCKRNIIRRCLQLKSKCLDFESRVCGRSGLKSECCECAFADCPLEPEGCKIMGQKCVNDKAVPFIAHQEFAKTRLHMKPGKIPIPINRGGAKTAGTFDLGAKATAKLLSKVSGATTAIHNKDGL